jgi:hypothetical protein
MAPLDIFEISVQMFDFTVLPMPKLFIEILKSVIENYQIGNSGFCKPTGLYIFHSKTCKRRIIISIGSCNRIFH